MGIEHAAGDYIGLLLLALFVAVLTNRFSGVPYTVGLVVVGLFLGLTRLGPAPGAMGFSKELIFFVLLPPLLFHGALHLELNRLLSHFWPIFTFAILGVVVSTALIGGFMYWIGGMGSLLLALLFGSMLSPTDPVSVLAVFKKAGVSKDLKHVVEGESLFNDGTGVVLFAILLGLVKTPGAPDVAGAVFEFAKVAGGGLIIGAGLGYVAWLFLCQTDDAVVETTACLVLAFGSFYLAEVLHLSGVIATVTSGLFIGNHGKRLAMTGPGIVVVNQFFSVIEFLINSVLFLLIGLEIRALAGTGWQQHLPLVGAGILGMLLARAAVVYPCWRALNLAGTQRPPRWAHVLFWGGLRGSIPIALVLSVLAEPDFPGGADVKNALLVATFGVVLFSLLVQGVTFEPLLRALKLKKGDES